MKYHLLVAASALVVGLGMSGAAFAGGNDHGGHGGDPGNNNHGTTSATSAAVALSDQDGAVMFNFAKGTAGNNTIGSVGGTGLVNMQQNNGANSILQDQNTLGAILNCSCTSSSSTNVLDVSLAASEQNALVLGNVSIGAENRTKSGSESGSGTFASAESSSSGGSSGHDGHDSHDSHGNNDGSRSHAEAASGSFAHAKTWSSSETAVASNNTLSSFTGTGLYNISQNNGNNSMLQSGNTVAAIIGK